MKKRVIVFLWCVVLSLNIFAVKKIVLNESAGIDILNQIESHDLFFKWIVDIDVNKDNELFFLDSRMYRILRINSDTGILINSIGIRGQGPGEFMDPFQLKVCKQKVYVADRGFNGLKIFSIAGILLKEFKTEYTTISCFDVNQSEQIFIKETKTDSVPIISLYSQKGKRQKTIIKLKNKTDDDAWKESILSTYYSHFCLDDRDNIIVVFDLDKILKKYDPNGNIIWEKKIKNEILDSFKDPDRPTRQSRNLTVTRHIYYFDIDRHNNIIIGHKGGGCVYNEDGQLIYIIEVLREGRSYEKGYLSLFKAFDGKLISRFVPGKTIKIFNLNL